MTKAAEIVAFWDQAGPDAWYTQDDAFDQTIRDRFGQDWERARAGEYDDWSASAEGALALILLFDQFPRNMFRGDATAFATDDQGIAVAQHMLDEGWDQEVDEPMRQFVYMPFMHSELPAHQDLCCALMETRMEIGNNALHAHAHRMIIDQFGRFPYRNDALGRETTPAERRFMDEGGYAGILRQLQRKTA
ncbi:DUF924 family protein [Gymnodinialimonas sp. 2305UL16-5]|uniref:DUF924 family protein n=1 Tax=Gymnodinialimonas mytili TaxID=3126503 RepID=UPI00309DF99B